MAISDTAQKNHNDLVSEYRVMPGTALTAGVTPVEAREIVYQAVPYAGMGKVFDFIHATNDVLAERGIQLPLPPQATTAPAARAERGRAGISVPGLELLTFAFLAALGGSDAQVKGHVAANFNVGNTRQALLGVRTALVPFIGYPARSTRSLRSTRSHPRPENGE